MSGARVTVGTDGRSRCWWCGDDPLYTDYHDKEWGSPLHDEHALFELLCLEGAQAGLSWITVLRKRETYRAAFEGFDPERMATYGSEETARLLGDPGIVRNRAKVAAFIANARALLTMHDGGETLEGLVWSFAEAAGTASAARKRLSPGEPVPATSEASLDLSKALKKRGFSFVGPTITYAYLQSSGVVDDHVSGCWRAD
jgi:DNA-3-methyladenine glycosylase I